MINSLLSKTTDKEFSSIAKTKALISKREDRAVKKFMNEVSSQTIHDAFSIIEKKVILVK